MDPAAVGQPSVDERHGVVKPPTHRSRQPLGQLAHLVVVCEPQPGQLQACASFDVDPVMAVDQDVGDTRLMQQRIERSCTDAVAT